jgi:hypothetical protein
MRANVLLFGMAEHSLYGSGVWLYSNLVEAKRPTHPTTRCL